MRSRKVEAYNLMRAAIVPLSLVLLLDGSWIGIEGLVFMAVTDARSGQATKGLIASCCINELCLGAR